MGHAAAQAPSRREGLSGRIKLSDTGGISGGEEGDSSLWYTFGGAHPVD